MKTKSSVSTLTMFVAVVLLATPGFADETKTAAPAGDVLEFIAEADFDAALSTGELTPGVFYWYNSRGDTSISPTPKVDGDIPFLELRGGVGERGISSYLDRITPVPEGSTVATVSLRIKVGIDPWAAKPASAAERSAVEAIFIDGQKSGGRVVVVSSLVNDEWVHYSKVAHVPPGAKFLRLRFSILHSFVVGIRDIEVVFR